jgi:hypothetical protein
MHHHEHRGRAEVGLSDDEHDRGAHHEQTADETVLVEHFTLLVGEEVRHLEQHGELGVLGGLDVEGTDVEAEVGAVAHLSEQHHEGEHHQRSRVADTRPVVEPVVFAPHHQRHHHHSHHEECLLAGDEVVAVGVQSSNRRFRVRRREDHQQADGREGADSGHQHPVDVATRGAPLPVNVAEARVGPTANHGSHPRPPFELTPRQAECRSTAGGAATLENRLSGSLTCTGSVFT